MALEDILVTVLTPGKATPAGAGFLVSPSLVITCAHVVNIALNREFAKGRPQGDVAVKLLATGSLPIPAHVDEADDAWSDPPTAGSEGSDFCLLRLASQLAIAPASLGIFTTELTGSRFRAAGFPPDWDVDYAHGDVAGRDGSGLFLLRPPDTQLATAATAVRTSLFRFDRRPPGQIYAGFSGGPVEVDGVVVGMLTQARVLIADATAYMLPVAGFPTQISRQAEVYAVGAGVPVKTYLESIALTSDVPQIQLERLVIRLPDNSTPVSQELKPQTIATGLEQDRKLALLSEPGMGKSAALKILERSLATDALREGIHSRSCSIPILVELKSYRGETDLTALLARRIDDILRLKLTKIFGNPAKTISEWLLDKNWHFLLLLDGLDEVPVQFHADIRIALKNLFNYPHQFVLSCRIADYDDSLRDRAVPYILCDLLPDGIAEHLERALGNLGKELFERLRTDPQLLSLASNPLMLEFMEEIARSDPSGQLPRNPGQLLSRLVFTMPLRRQSEGFLPGAPHDRIVTALATIGFEMLQRGEVMATLGDIREWQIPCGTHELEKLLDVAKDWRLLFSDGTRGEPVQFIHPLFRDYFAAVRADSQLSGNRLQDSESIYGKIVDRRWWQTLIMMCGISRQPAEFITNLADELRLMASTRTLFYFGMLQEYRQPLPYMLSFSIQTTVVSFLIRSWRSGPAARDPNVQSAVVGALCRVLRTCPVRDGPVSGSVFGECLSAIYALQEIGDERALADLDWFSDQRLGPYEYYAPPWRPGARVLFKAAREAATAIREKFSGKMVE
jgi:hypothetical protein